MAIKVKDDAAKTSHHLNHFVMEKLFYQVYDDVFKSTRNKGIFLFWTWTCKILLKVHPIKILIRHESFVHFMT